MKRSVIASITVLFSITMVGCLGSSTYKQGVQKAGQPSTSQDSSTEDPTSTSDEPAEEPTKVLTPRAFGLNECVEEGFNALDPALIYQPLEIKRDLDSYKDKSSIANISEWYDLVDLLLREIVKTQHISKAESHSRIDYKRLLKDHPNSLLKPWNIAIEYLSSLPEPSKSEKKDEYITYYTNAYNLMMIDLIRKKLVKDIKYRQIDDEVFFITEKFQLHGNTYTLNNLEYGKLQMNSKEAMDTRLHAALVCGAVSCPKLRPIALRPENYKIILNENISMFFNSDYHIRPDATPPTASQLLKWFNPDFVVMWGKKEDKGKDKERNKSLLIECSGSQEALDKRKAFISKVIAEDNEDNHHPYSFEVNIVKD